MQLKSYFRISTPSTSKVPASEVETEYKRLRRQTFWGVTAAYSLYYVCRMTLSVVKQPVIDDGIMTAAQLGLVDSAMLLVYAVGKFCNGFVADYCNIRRFMAWGLIVSAFVNLVLGVLGVVSGVTSTVLFVLFALLWGANGWAQSMGAPPGVISLSRWYPLSRRGTMYSIFSSTPYLGKSLTFIIIGLIVGAVGWQWGFIFASVAGLIGALVVLIERKVLLDNTPSEDYRSQGHDVTGGVVGIACKAVKRRLVCLEDINIGAIYLGRIVGYALHKDKVFVAGLLDGADRLVDLRHGGVSGGEHYRNTF